MLYHLKHTAQWWFPGKKKLYVDKPNRDYVPGQETEKHFPFKLAVHKAASASSNQGEPRKSLDFKATEIKTGQTHPGMGVFKAIGSESPELSTLAFHI